MTAEDAVAFNGEFANTIGRDIVPVTPGASPVLTDSAGRVQVAFRLIIAAAGNVTITTLAGNSRTFNATGMTYPVQIDVFFTHVTASVPTVYAVF